MKNGSGHQTVTLAKWEFGVIERNGRDDRAKAIMSVLGRSCSISTGRSMFPWPIFSGRKPLSLPEGEGALMRCGLLVVV